MGAYVCLCESKRFERMNLVGYRNIGIVDL
jgi:hypothetical protein